MQATVRDVEYGEIMEMLLESMGNSHEVLQKWYVRGEDDWGTSERKLMFIRKKEFFSDLKVFLGNKDIENDKGEDERRVEFLGLSQRTVNALMREECGTVGKMKEKSLSDYRGMLGIGVYGLKEIGEFLGWGAEVVEGITYKQDKK